MPHLLGIDVGGTFTDFVAHDPAGGLEVWKVLSIPANPGRVEPRCGIRANLAPDDAVIKPSAATPSLLRHRGRAVVFESIEHCHACIADPALEVDASSVLVLKGCGPKGYPGMPECGNADKASASHSHRGRTSLEHPIEYKG